MNEGEENYKDFRSYLDTRTYSNMSIHMFSLKFTVQQKGEVSISRTISTLLLKLTKTRKNWRPLQEKTLITEEIRDETCVYEQKLIKIDDFNEDEEKEVKERVKKWK